MRKLKSKRDIHWERKFTHILGILLITSIYFYLPMSITWTLFFTVALPFILLDFARFKFPYLMQLGPKLFGKIMREQEMQRLSGTTFLFIGLSITMFSFPKVVATLAFLFLAFADPIASIIGIKYGKKKLGKHKTILGSFAAFTTCLAVASLYIHFYPIDIDSNKKLFFILSAGLIGSFSEALTFKLLDDNFTQPVLNSLLLYYLFYLLSPQTIGAL